MNNFNRTALNPNSGRESLTLLDISKAILRHKNLLIIPTLITLGVAVLFNQFSGKVYQSDVVIKKERPINERSTDELRNILLMRTSDQVETEMELIKSRTVLSKVVKDLNLNIKIEKLELPGKGEVPVNKNLYEYSNSFAGKKESSFAYPIFPKVKMNNPLKSGSYYIKKIDNHFFGLYDAISDSLLQTIRN